MLIFTTTHKKLFCICIYLLTANSKCSDYQRHQAEHQAEHQAPLSLRLFAEGALLAPTQTVHLLALIYYIEKLVL